MRKGRSGFGKRARGWFLQSGAFLALLGFLFAATTPAMSMAAMAESAGTVGGFVGTYICHAPGSPLAGQPDDGQPRAHTCCLVCQVAQMAAGAVAPAPLDFPAPPGHAVRLRADLRADAHGAAARHAQARAPPAA